MYFFYYSVYNTFLKEPIFTLYTVIEMDFDNITASDVYSEAEAHPYISIIILVIVLFVLGTIAACMKTTHNGARAIGWGLYYLTAPIHIPLRWACECI